VIAGGTASEIWTKQKIGVIGPRRVIELVTMDDGAS
jgi:hypothetical protein